MLTHPLRSSPPLRLAAFLALLTMYLAGAVDNNMPNGINMPPMPQVGGGGDFDKEEKADDAQEKDEFNKCCCIIIVVIIVVLVIKVRSPFFTHAVRHLSTQKSTYVKLVYLSTQKSTYVICPHRRARLHDAVESYHGPL